MLLFLGLLVMQTSGAAETPTDLIPTEAPAGLREAAIKGRAAVFFISRKIAGGAAVDAGFFISDSGLALCPLNSLWPNADPTFKLTRDGKGDLKHPIVLSVFPEKYTALLKFDHKPKHFLALSSERAPVGTWVAVLSTGYTTSQSVLGPIVAHRIGSNVSPLTTPIDPQICYSIAAGRNPGIEPVFMMGAPVLDMRGQVAAVFNNSVPQLEQTFRIAMPTVGMSKWVDEAVEKGEQMSIPLTFDKLFLDPAACGEDVLMMHAFSMRGQFAKARHHAKEALKKFPKSAYVRSQEHIIAISEVYSGQGGSPDELVALAKQSEPRQDDSLFAKAAYLDRLGQAMAFAGQDDEAIDALRKSDKLDPRAMACMSLAGIYGKHGQLEESERYWRSATTLSPDSILYWESFQKVLAARSNWKEADEVGERVFLLEELYRSR